jgi:hypothetical protein
MNAFFIFHDLTHRTMSSSNPSELPLSPDKADCATDDDSILVLFPDSVLGFFADDNKTSSRSVRKHKMETNTWTWEILRYRQHFAHTNVEVYEAYYIRILRME